MNTQKGKLEKEKQSTSPVDPKNSGNVAIEKSFIANVPYELIDWKQSIDLTKEDQAVIIKELENYKLVFYENGKLVGF
ncbi:hypothetical protein [Chryseobacterium sp. M5A1_1a]